VFLLFSLSEVFVNHFLSGVPSFSEQGDPLLPTGSPLREMIDYKYPGYQVETTAW